MGSKHASVHLRCDNSNSTEVLAKLKKLFNRKKKNSKKDTVALELIKAIVNKNISTITDPAEKAEKEALFEQAIKNMNPSDDPAVIIVWNHFISIYWYDHIRNENLREEMLRYAQMCGVPAMGVGIYDDTNFSIYAACNVGQPNARSCQGEYIFDFDDITPVKVSDICDIVDAPFFLDALQKVLSKDDGEAMASTFEQETGLPILLFNEECQKSGMKQLYHWYNATVYCKE